MGGNARVMTGLERFVSEKSALVGSSAIGLLVNQASVDSSLRYAWDVVDARYDRQIKALLSPQHGLWGEEQANMIETPHGHSADLDVPVFSLYSDTRAPTPEMLDRFEVLVIDLMDVGTRVYTFVWTMMNCLVACADANKRVVILDRPNPLGGNVVEGPILGNDFRSFVGQASIPMRHALTMGELALFLRHEFAMNVDLQIVQMRGWQRRMLFPKTRLPWVAPSPNMPQFETAVVYPGQVLLEGTNLSEGRGTTFPFQLVGAPFVDENKLFHSLVDCDLPGVIFRPVRFRPAFDKWKDQSCGGIAIQIADPGAVRSYEMTVTLMRVISEQCDEFDWLPPPYEYETDKMPIDILSGDDHLRTLLDSSNSNLSRESLSELWKLDKAEWRQRVDPYLLYE